MNFARPVGNSLREDNPHSMWVFNVSRNFLIFSYGLFSIAAQTLLFREFITTFEGNDISVGIFFGSWFLWVGLGAVIVYRAKGFTEKLLKNIEFLILCFLPAFVLELILIIQARELAGVESYALLPIRTILLLAMLVNAPVSIITGMTFPVACRWFQSKSKLAVSRVYIMESAGSFCGGLGVTILLAFGANSARIFFILAFILSLPIFLVQFGRILEHRSKVTAHNHTKTRTAHPTMAYLFSFLIPLSILICLAVGIDKSLMRYVRVIKWTKLLPKEALTGSFHTPQAEYLYGNYQGQWIAVREGSVCETLPDETNAGRIAAIGLCQNPQAKRILVIGSGLALCNSFLKLPQIENVTWAHFDNEYIQQVNEFVPQDFRISDTRFNRLAGDVRPLLARKKQNYDIVVLNLPEATSSVLNRYYTLEFYHQIKESLSSDGLLEVSVAGGENIMGTELVNLGASTKLTLEKVFSQLVLTPGEQTWFIVSDSENLSSNPGILKDRFETIKGATDVLSPQALLSVYLPDRAEKALKDYSSADLPKKLLVNRDSRPLTNLYSLLLAAKQSGAPVTRFVKHLTLAGPSAFFIPILIFLVFRTIYVTKTVHRRSSSDTVESISAHGFAQLLSFDSTFLVFAAGWLGIGVAIILMYLYQTRFGSLYLHIGVTSSVFMMGLTIGAITISHLLNRESLTSNQPINKIARTNTEILLFGVVIVHTVALAAIAFCPIETWTHLFFIIAFVLCGLCTGCYFPLAARQLGDSGFEPGQAGSKLERADHLGASAGAVLTGLLLVPVLGTRATLLLYIVLMLVTLLCHFFLKRASANAEIKKHWFSEAQPSGTAAFRLRRLGYVLFGVGASIILCSNLLDVAGAKLRLSLPEHSAQALAGALALEKHSATVTDDSGNTQDIYYFKVYKSEQTEPNNHSTNLEQQELTGYIFSSEDLAPEVRGFGGKINLGVYVDTTGRLLDFHIIRSNETPAYLELLKQWLDSLRSTISKKDDQKTAINTYQLFQPEPFAGVHAVTGATVSSEAIISTLEKSGHKFAREVLGQALLYCGFEEKRYGAKYIPDTNAIYLIAAIIFSLLVIYYGGFWSRLVILIYNLIIGGIILNAQYSSEQIATLLSLQSPALRLTGTLLLVVGVPVLIIFFGNIYCGYLCPFGAVQELLSYVIPQRYKELIPRERMKKARFVKYVVLFILITVFFISRNRTTLAVDPLIKIFTGNPALFTASAILIAAFALAASLFYSRFWCRYLCPVGAFLSLFNGIVILRRFVPVKKFGHCEFGLTAKDQLDCIYCDRCRYIATKVYKHRVPAYTPTKLISEYLMVAVLVIAIFLTAVSVDRLFQVLPSGDEYTAVSVASGGQPRDVDLQQIRTMIEQKKLSDQEAKFYKKLE